MKMLRKLVISIIITIVGLMVATKVVPYMQTAYTVNAASIKIIKESFIWQRPGFIVFVLAMITTVICLLVSLKLYSLKKQQRKTEKFFIEVIEAFVGTIDVFPRIE